MTQDQLEQLILLTASHELNHGDVSWGGSWACHAITCLLQDILDGTVSCVLCRRFITSSSVLKARLSFIYYSVYMKLILALSCFIEGFLGRMNHYL